MPNNASSAAHSPAAAATHAQSNQARVDDDAMSITSTVVNEPMMEHDQASMMTRVGHDGLRGRLDNLRDGVFGTKEERAARAEARRVEASQHVADLSQGRKPPTFDWPPKRRDYRGLYH